MTLVQAKLQRLDQSFNSTGDAIVCQFNPTELTMTKGSQMAEIAIPGLFSPLLQFVRGQAETLTADLFFDTTDGGTGDHATAVTTRTDRVYELVRIDPATHAPPVCDFSWATSGFPGSHLDADMAGQQRQSSFRCVVESVRQRFTLFNPAGVPLRATLSVTLKEYKTLRGQLSQLGLLSADHTHAHVVAEGDTLTRIAAAVYDDPRQWRHIADANNIVDPLALEPGSILVVPPVA
jgi:contractile injection system tube protein/LysM domain-containing protein